MIDSDLRMRELEHRFRNILTIVRSVVSQSLASASSLDAARITIDRRLEALGSAMHELLSHQWEAAPLSVLAKQALAHFTLHAERVRLDGPTVMIGPKAALTLTLAFHELATNAIKYGALSNATGVVDLSWRVAGSGTEAMLWLQWAERAGPPVVKPERQGFGTRLICTATGRSLNGRAELEFPEAGIVWSLVSPIASIVE